MEPSWSFGNLVGDHLKIRDESEPTTNLKRIYLGGKKIEFRPWRYKECTLTSYLGGA